MNKDGLLPNFKFSGTSIMKIQCGPKTWTEQYKVEQDTHTQDLSCNAKYSSCYDQPV